MPREVPQAVAAHPPAIAIKGHATRTPIPSEEAYDRSQSRLRVKICPGLGHEPGGGSSIHEIENLYHMLLFAIGIRRHARCILLHRVESLPEDQDALVAGENDEGHPGYSRTFAGHARWYVLSAAGAGLAPAVPYHEVSNRGLPSALASGGGSQVGVRESPQCAG